MPAWPGSGEGSWLLDGPLLSVFTWQRERQTERKLSGVSSCKDTNPIMGVAPPVSKSVSKVAQSCPTLCDPMDGSLPGSSVHGIFQARVLEWVAIFFSRGSS